MEDYGKRTYTRPEKEACDAFCRDERWWPGLADSTSGKARTQHDRPYI